MRLIGHELKAFKPLFWRDSEAQILKDCKNLFKFSPKMIKKAQILGANFSVVCKNLNEIIIANEAGAELIVVDKILIKKAIKLAEFYLFDAKIACVIESENELSELGELGADVALFSSAIVRE